MQNVCFYDVVVGLHNLNSMYLNHFAMVQILYCERLLLLLLFQCATYEVAISEI